MLQFMHCPGRHGNGTRKWGMAKTHQEQGAARCDESHTQLKKQDERRAAKPMEGKERQTDSNLRTKLQCQFRAEGHPAKQQGGRRARLHKVEPTEEWGRYIQSQPDTGAGQGREYQHEVEPHGLQRRLGQAKASRVWAPLRARDANDMYEGMNDKLTLHEETYMMNK